MAGEPPGRSWTRQTRATMGTGGALIVAGVGWTMWRTTGSRLFAFLCFAALAAILLDLVLAVVATARVTVTVEDGPVNVYVGDRVPFTVSLRGPGLTFYVRSLVPGGIEAVTPPGSGPFVAFVDRRQVVASLEVEISGSGLCGLVTCARRLQVPLRAPLHVGPRPAAPPHPFPELFGAWGEGAPRPAAVGDVVRGVRDYLPGDPMRRVHWATSARRGELVVKELEEPTAPRLVVALDLGAGGLAGELAAARAAWYAYEALGRGYEVVLATAEPGGPATGRIGPPTDVNERLARAARGAPQLPVGGVGKALVMVTPQGDSWPA